MKPVFTQATKANMYPKTEKAVVLLSGGQDSTTSLYWAQSQFECIAVSIWYGQRHESELAAAREIAEKAGVEHHIIKVPEGLFGTDSALVNADADLEGSGGIVDDAMPEGLPTSFVPGRNMVFLSMAAAFAGSRGIRRIVTGVCQTDYSGYPDCRAEFIQGMQTAASLAMPSSLRPIEILTPLMDLTKAQTVELARQLVGCWDALALSVTCYNGERPGCGTCPACELRAKGFGEAGLADPAEVA